MEREWREGVGSGARGEGGRGKGEGNSLRFPGGLSMCLSRIIYVFIMFIQEIVGVDNGICLFLLLGGAWFGSLIFPCRFLLAPKNQEFSVSMPLIPFRLSPFPFPLLPSCGS